MRFIALRNFRNPGRAIDLGDDALHDDHVHKGAIFAIGEDELVEEDAVGFKRLNKNQQMLVAQLNAANCIGNAANPKVVAAVKRELADEAKAAAELKKQQERLDAKNAELTAAAAAAGKGKGKDKDDKE